MKNWYFELPSSMKAWFVLLWLTMAGIWMGILLSKGYSAKAAARAEINQKTGFNRWWAEGAWVGSSDDDQAAVPYFIGACIGALAMCLPARIGTELTRSYLTFKKNAHDKKQEEFERNELEARARASEQENAIAFQQMNLSQSKRELVARLSAIDQFIRVLEGEPNPSRRTATMLSAQSEIAAVVGKVASSEIISEALLDSHVRAHATETYADLVRLGLKSDRLARDICRVFQVIQTPSESNVS